MTIANVYNSLRYYVFVFTYSIYPHPRGIQNQIFSSYLSSSQRNTKRDIFLLSIHIPEGYKTGYFPLIYPHPRGIQSGVFSCYLSTSQRDTKRGIFLLSIHIPEEYKTGYFPVIYPHPRGIQSGIFSTYLSTGIITNSHNFLFLIGS